jgi:hypothetical protein
MTVSATYVRALLIADMKITASWINKGMYDRRETLTITSPAERRDIA